MKSIDVMKLYFTIQCIFKIFLLFLRIQTIKSEIHWMSFCFVQINFQGQGDKSHSCCYFLLFGVISLLNKKILCVYWIFLPLLFIKRSVLLLSYKISNIQVKFGIARLLRKTNLYRKWREMFREKRWKLTDKWFW